MEFRSLIGSIILWSSFVMQILLLQIPSAFSLHGANDTDKLSLVAFKAQITDDPLGILNSWNDSLHFCAWTGITCGRRHQRVTMLDIQASDLKGRLSPYIGNLSFLRMLNLNNNSLSHDIPSEIGRLFRLQELRLANNSFSGEIPVNISRCSNLQYLSLGSNNLTGQLPKDLGLLSQLQALYLYRNNFVGEIPTSFGNLSSLELLAIPRNNLQGRIPNSIGQLKSLYHLSLGTNNLSGTIPPSIYNLSFIKYFSVQTNQLHGTLPPDLGLTLPNLQVLMFHTNHFSGSIPVSVSNASNLLFFDIGINNFTGTVPSFNSLCNIWNLDIDDNNLGGGKRDDLNFLSSIANCTKLEVFGINNNNFGGELPAIVGNFSTKLRTMTFGRNQISGSIPAGIGNLISLETLDFEGNQLSGSIPSSIGKLRKLNSILLDKNELSGIIPPSLGNLTLLNNMYLTFNNFQGSIPSSLGECKNLLAMDLSLNNLSGQIPKQVVGLSSLSKRLDLSYNYLTGSIPTEVGALKNLGYLNLGENNLSGGIPETLGSCTSLVYLNLERNSLQGSIPQSLSSLKGIEEIKFSHNNLSGKIPTYLEGFHFLKNLDLSFNEFEGEVPIQGIFKNATALSIGENRRLCGGIPQLNLLKCTSNLSNTNSKPSAKLKLIIPVVFGLLVLVILTVYLLLHYRLRKTKNKSTFGSPLDTSLLKVSYGDLLKATDGFSSMNLIGGGSFGSVYKGSLDHEERQVAVKVLNLQSSRASKSFIAECEALRSIRHRNLIKLITACSSIDFQGNDFNALVYEFMTNGSLESWLHPDHNVVLEQEQRHLDLIQRINIAIDVATAIDYLHNHCHASIVHCDLKPSNILLDNEMVAHVGDFGLARFLPDPSRPFSSDQSSNTIGIKGSIGYAAPEYGMGSQVSKHGDVYSYGVLLLEMISGKRPTDGMFKDGLNLRNFVMAALPTRVEEILDPVIFQIQESSTTRWNSIRKEHIQECLVSIARIGVGCCAEFAKERMEISNAVAELCLVRDILFGNRRPKEHN